MNPAEFFYTESQKELTEWRIHSPIENGWEDSSV